MLLGISLEIGFSKFDAVCGILTTFGYEILVRPIFVRRVIWLAQSVIEIRQSILSHARAPYLLSIVFLSCAVMMQINHL